MSLRAQHFVGGTLASSPQLHTHTRKRTPTHTHAYTQLHTHTHKQKQMHTHTHTHTHAHTHTHTQQMSWRAQHIFGRSPRKLAHTFGGGEEAVLEEEAV